MGCITFGEEEALHILLVGKVFRDPDLKRQLAEVGVKANVSGSVRGARRVIGGDSNHFDAVICQRLGDEQLIRFARRLRAIRHRVLDTGMLFARAGHRGLARFDQLTNVGYRRCDISRAKSAILDALGRDKKSR